MSLFVFISIRSWLMKYHRNRSKTTSDVLVCHSAPFSRDESAKSVGCKMHEAFATSLRNTHTYTHTHASTFSIWRDKIYKYLVETQQLLNLLLNGSSRNTDRHKRWCVCVCVQGRRAVEQIACGWTPQRPALLETEKFPPSRCSSCDGGPWTGCRDAGQVLVWLCRIMHGYRGELCALCPQRFTVNVWAPSCSLISKNPHNSHTHTQTVSTCMKLNSLQLSALLTEGRELIPNRRYRQNPRIPIE